MHLLSISVLPFGSPIKPLSFRAYQRKIGASPQRLPVIVASLEPMISTSLDNALMYSRRVITTPQGIGHPKNLWPKIVILPMSFLKVILGAYAINHPKTILDICFR